MRLTKVRIQRFKNVVDEQVIDIEDDVTCFVGKNEAGKTTILKALHRLNPANGSDVEFDLTTEYPRWRLSRDRRVEDLETVCPVTAWFTIEPNELANVADLPNPLPAGAELRAARSYGNELLLALECPLASVIRAAAADASIDAADVGRLLTAASADEAITISRALAKELKESEASRSKVLGGFPKAIESYAAFTGAVLERELANALVGRMPTFFYFSTYDLLPGECDLNRLAAKVKAGTKLTPSERTVVSLLARAGEDPDDFLDDDYDSRKAELQAASAELTQHVFEYWTQNTDLDVVFDTDMIAVDGNPQPEYHRMLKIEIRDGRHGGVETNFATRSSGFQWFFSFFAAFSEHQDSDDPIIVLLDEPGTSLHGEAQKDFLRFVFDELGAAKQTLYTTHSQYMVDPSRYEKMRAVHDRATRQNPDLGVAVSRVSLSADRDTVLPVESALGYSISQHLFIGGGHHLAVEGSSDFVYLQRATEHLSTIGLTGLDPRLSIIPVGGDANMPAFVALLGRRLKVSALIDGARTQPKLDRVKKAATSNGVSDAAIVVCGDVEGVPANADIEDMFDPEDYLRLYNWTFGTNLTLADLPATDEPIVKRLEAVQAKFDHALPAHILTERRQEFFAAALPLTIERFAKLFQALNATIV
jgi:energy-coupling factor transporter ATP-binding protein EcfA2